MKFGSVTTKLNLTANFQVTKQSNAKSGDVILAEVLSLNSSYPYLEQPDGQLIRLEIGDMIVGVIGARQALRSFVGYCPQYLDDSVNLSLLNMGGVIGCCIDSAMGLGQPPQVKYLGTLLDEKGTLNMSRCKLPHKNLIQKNRPIILILGTCMNVGKTSIAANMIKEATQLGFKVGAAKLAGVAAIKDLKYFENAGAIDVKSFLDCGIPSTVDTSDLAPIVKDTINSLKGDLIIIELGDGIMGHYKIETVLMNRELMSKISSIIVCAMDIAAAYGAKQYLKELGVNISVMSGPATDNIAGIDFIENKFGIPAINGMKFPAQLFEKTSVKREICL